MKRSILGMFLALAVTVATELAAAPPGGVTTAKVTEFGLIPGSNTAWVKMASMTTNPSAPCATANYFAVNISSDIGKNVFRVLLSAQVQGLPLTIWGTGTCAQSAGSEDILYVWYNPPT